jgi:hypothetical protein
MAAWLRRAVPFVAAGLALWVADLLEPITNRAWAPAILPAVVAGTWVLGWRGGLLAMSLGIVGRMFLLSTPLWRYPGWMTSWLVLHAMAIVVTSVARSARADAADARRIQREQAGRASKALAARRADFLAHASDVLASSPDYETTLAAVANLAVPQIADICVVDIVNDAGEFVPLAVAHVDARKIELVRELRRLYPLDPQSPFGPAKVLRTGQSVIHSELSELSGGDPSIHPSDLRVALALGIWSTMAVPLRVGGRRLGVISFATTDRSRRFVASDLQFAEDLARRAAIAIDTAHP